VDLIYLGRGGRDRTKEKEGGRTYQKAGGLMESGPKGLRKTRPGKKGKKEQGGMGRTKKKRKILKLKEYYNIKRKLITTWKQSTY